MEAKTLKALRGSIEKWKKIEGSTRALDKHGENCPLCALFFNEPCCGDCPIAKKREPRCNNTIYARWVTHHEEKHNFKGWGDLKRIKNCPTCLVYATAERKFLESLLPKGEKP